MAFSRNDYVFNGHSRMRANPLASYHTATGPATEPPPPPPPFVQDGGNGGGALRPTVDDEGGKQPPQTAPLLREDADCSNSAPLDDDSDVDSDATASRKGTRTRGSRGRRPSPAVRKLHCRQFNDTGTCTFEAQCKYSHDVVAPVPKAKSNANRWATQVQQRRSANGGTLHFTATTTATNTVSPAPKGKGKAKRADAEA